MALSVESIDAAIAAIISGRVSSYTLPDGTSVTKLNLDALMKLRDTAASEAQAATSATFRPVAFGRGGKGGRR